MQSFYSKNFFLCKCVQHCPRNNTETFANEFLCVMNAKRARMLDRMGCLAKEEAKDDRSDIVSHDLIGPMIQQTWFELCLAAH